MQLRQMLGSVGLVVVALGWSMPREAAAQDWPGRPVTIVVPYPAGGPNDTLARVVAKKLGDSFGAAFIIENRVGAGGNIGANAVAKSKPDGYTLLFTSTGPQANNKFLYPTLPYDPVKDFSAVVLIAKTPVIFMARAKAPFTTFAEMVAFAKANPGKLTIGTSGHGSVSHIASEYLQAVTGIQFLNVPFAGSAPLIQGLLSNDLDLVSDLVTSHVPMLQEKQYKAVLLAAYKHSTSLPNVPNFTDVGMASFEATAWSALMAPANTPAPIITRINTSVNEWIKSPEGQKQIASLEMMAEGGSPADLDTFIANEIDKWGPIIKKAGIVAK